MRPIISVVGRSNSGKTTLLEGLVAELKRRNYRVAVIKHAGNCLDLDDNGKDSWRLSKAGSEVVVASSASKVVVVKQVDGDLEPHQLSRVIGWDYDFILTEGFKKANIPKIEVHRRGQGKELVCAAKQLIAVVTDEPLDVNVPQFAMDDFERLADLIEEKLGDQLKSEHFEVSVNGEHIQMNPFVRDIVAGTVAAMVSSLKEVKEIKDMRIVMRRGG